MTKNNRNNRNNYNRNTYGNTSMSLFRTDSKLIGLFYSVGFAVAVFAVIAVIPSDPMTLFRNGAHV